LDSSIIIITLQIIIVIYSTINSIIYIIYIDMIRWMI